MCIFKNLNLRMLKRTIYIIGIGWLLLSVRLEAQRSLRFEHLSVDKGLSQSSVNDMVQDHFGFLWLATFDGLNRYDGYQFRVYRHSKDDPASLHANRVTDLFVDRHQQVWAASAGALCRYHPEKDNFDVHVIHLDGQRRENVLVNDLFEEPDGKFKVATDQGLVDFDPVTGTFDVRPEDRLFLNRPVSSYVHLPDDDTWVFCRDTIYRRSPQATQWERIPSRGINTSAYFPAQRKMYARFGSTVRSYDLDTRTLRVVGTLPDYFSIFPAMLLTSQGEFWMSSNQGVYIFGADGQRAEVTPVEGDPFSLSGNQVKSLYQTFDGVIWVGTSGFGLNKYDPQANQFQYLGTVPGAALTLSNPYVDVMYTDDDRELLVSTVSGVDRIDLVQRTAQHLTLPMSDLPYNRARSFCRDRQGRFWVGTSYGVYWLEGNRFVHAGLHFLDSASVTGIQAVDAQTLLISSVNGVFVVSPGQRQHRMLCDWSEPEMLRVGDTLWLGSSLGSRVRCYNWRTGDLLQSFTYNSDHPEQAPSGPIKCIYRDSRGRIWFGSAGGGLSLYRPATRTFTHYSEKDGLPNATVYGVLEDAQHALWLSTNKGLCRFSPDTRQCLNFDASDGLQSNEFNTHAYFQSPSGRLYFGGINGLNFFDPADITVNSYVPHTVFTRYYVNNEAITHYTDRVEMDSVSQSTTLFLRAHERDFAVDIAGLGFSFPGRTRYRFQLENYNNRWEDIQDQRHIVFTNIPPGRYVLKVKSSNAWGQWEIGEARLVVLIEGPVWQKPWFAAAMVAGILIVFALIYWWRIYALKQRTLVLRNIVEQRTREIQLKNEEIAAQNEQLQQQTDALARSNDLLEQRVRERTEALQNLNVDLISQNTRLEQFTFITAHNIRGPVASIKGLLNLLQGQLQGQDIYRHLLNSVDNLDEVIADLMSVLTLRNPTEGGEERVNLREMLEDTLALLEDNVSARQAVVMHDGFPDLWIRGRKPYVVSIFYNLLHNALRFSHPQRSSQIAVKGWTATDGSIVVTIRDNGMGIDMRYASEKIFGLYQRFHEKLSGKGLGLLLVKTQVEAMKGEIHVDSVVGEGSVFTVKFPGPASGAAPIV